MIIFFVNGDHTVLEYSKIGLTIDICYLNDRCSSITTPIFYTKH